MRKLLDRFDPMGQTARLVDGATAYAETPAAGPIFRGYLRANHGVSLADFNEWPTDAKERVMNAWTQSMGLHGGHDNGPSIGRREYENHPTFDFLEDPTRTDDRRVMLKCLLTLAVIGGIVLWAWWRG